MEILIPHVENYDSSSHDPDNPQDIASLVEELLVYFGDREGKVHVDYSRYK
jgi:hypothetical protein